LHHTEKSREKMPISRYISGDKPRVYCFKKTFCLFFALAYFRARKNLRSMSRKKSARRSFRRRKDKPHDAVFKAFFSDARIARNYLLHYTPESVHTGIDFTHFRKSDTAYVSGRFGIAFSDVVYDTRLAGGGPARLLFLFEHKSALPRHPVYLQLLDYLLQIWEDDLKNARSLSFIIPIVVYHGSVGWEQRPFWEYFPGMPENWRPFVPHFDYLLTDLSRIPLQAIRDKRESEYLRNLFLALKFAGRLEQIRQHWTEILSFRTASPNADRERILLQTLTLYLVNLHDMKPTEVQTLSETLPEAERDWIDEIPAIFGKKWKREGLREGRAEGRAIGITEGRVEGRAEGRVEGRAEGRAEGKKEQQREFTIRTLRAFPEWSDEQVAGFVGVTLEFVRQLREELKAK